MKSHISQTKVFVSFIVLDQYRELGWKVAKIHEKSRLFTNKEKMKKAGNKKM